MDYLIHTPKYWCVIAHSLYVTNKQRPANRDKEYWVKSLVLAFIGTFGGSGIAMLLLGLPPQWLIEDKFVVTNCLIWYLMNYSPFDVVHTVYNLPGVHHVGVAFEWLHKTHSMTKAVDTAIAKYSHSMCAAVVTGVVATYGGSFVTTLERQARGEGLPTELTKPAWTIRAVFFGAVFYYIAVFNGNAEALIGGAGHYLSHDNALLCVLCFFIGSAVIRESVYASFNPFSPIEWLFYLVTGLPTSNAQALKSKRDPLIRSLEVVDTLSREDREELIREIRKRTVSNVGDNKNKAPNQETPADQAGPASPTTTKRKSRAHKET